MLSVSISFSLCDCHAYDNVRYRELGTAGKQLENITRPIGLSLHSPARYLGVSAGISVNYLLTSDHITTTI